MNQATRQIFLDVETTGLSFSAGHRVIEIGCVEVFNRRSTKDNNIFHQYLNPQCAISEEAQSVHGISNEFLQDKPLFAAVAEELYEFIRGAEIIAHNAKFDISFLENEFSLAGLKCGKITDFCAVVDTLEIARKLHPGLRNNLDALCKRYGIDNSHRELHGALLDANILVELYFAMTRKQGNLFDEENNTIMSSRARAFRRSTSDALPIINAKPNELEEHQKFLELLRKKTKKK
jgi:DNA polymerase-3 subunit epsilon